MKKFFLFEVKYWIKQPMTWVFLIVNALLIFGAMTSEFINIGGGVGNTHKNAPLAIEAYFANMSLLGIVAITAFFNATATRDYTYGMDQIVFASPVKKFGFFFGKFFGALAIAVIPFLGITLAAILAPMMPWVEPARYGAFIWQAHMYGFLLFAVFNSFFGGAIIYAFAMYFRNPIISYLASFGIIILYIISSTLTRDVENQTIAMFSDPIGLRAFGLYTKYWTPAQRNGGYIGFEGVFLLSRLLWAAISIGILFSFYRLFDFTKPRTSRKRKAELKEAGQLVYNTVPVAKIAQKPVLSWLRLFNFELKGIIGNNSFIILTIIGVINLSTNLFFNTSNYGEKNLPVTYNMVDSIRGSMYLFVVAFMVFYSGYIVFKERDARLNEITDATPVKDGLVVTTKMAAIIVALGFVFIGCMLLCIISQATKGYFNFEIGVYTSMLGLDLLGFSFLIVLSYLFQSLINNKYLAYFVIVAFLIANTFLWQALRVESNMVKYGSLPSVTYSDMNAFGPFIPGSVAFGIYWSLASALLILLAIGMQIRGKENAIRQRLRNLQVYVRCNIPLILVLAVLFVACSAWVFYNTEVMNTYTSSKQAELNQVEYERKYKQYENMPLPFTQAIDFGIDIFPKQRDMHVNIKWWIKNVHDKPITELQYNIPDKARNMSFSIPGAKLFSEDKKLQFNRYLLQKPLLPGDSLQLNFVADFINDGFENEVSFTQLTQNGSFFPDGAILPLIGYNKNNELESKNERKKYKLPVRERMAKLTRNCTEVCNTTYISNSATWVRVKTIISTSGDQMAIAPGSLVKQWKQNGRNYYVYELKHEVLNFFSFISAQYLVKRDKVNGIDVEVYYDKKHPENVDRMVLAIKNALKYYTTNFGPYFHEQCRIIEFPRYATFAQAFPGTMPYSEGIGFITDLRDSTAIDMVTYVISHEMGHQWWAHQVTGPDMQGSEMFSEGLAQYSALMVMEKTFGKQQIHRFLKYEMDGYLRGRSNEAEYENPLMKTEHQAYIHYQKAGIVFYYLKEMIGEDKMNEALHKVVSKYAYNKPPFPTAYNVMDEIKAVTPDSLQYLIADMFETITLFNNRVDKATFMPLGAGKFKVSMKVVCEKAKSDSLGNEKPVLVNDYIDIGCFAENKKDGKNFGDVIAYQRVRIDRKDTTLTLIVDRKPYQVGIDPYHFLIDKVIADNVKKVE